jgi:hypothetical protein
MNASIPSGRKFVYGAIDKKLKEGNNWHEAAAFNLRQIANNRSIKFLALSIMQYSVR